MTPPGHPTPQTVGDTADTGGSSSGGAAEGVPQAVTTGGTPKPQKRVHPLSDDFANTVAVCSLMKDEEVADVREWLEYHRCGPQATWQAFWGILSPCSWPRKRSLALPQSKAMPSLVRQSFISKLGQKTGKALQTGATCTHAEVGYPASH